MLNLESDIRSITEAEKRTMTRKINLKSEVIAKDLEKILFEKDKSLREYEGYKPANDERRYICAIAIESFYAGANRVVLELNKQADREISQAQTKAIRCLMKGQNR